jgi:DNA-binding transcriptional MocR family regulator
MATKHGKSGTLLYEKVADKIARQIDNGTLLPGERIPSVRKLNTQLGVSMSTVLQSYMLLEDKGLIEARPQSGFYVRLHKRYLPPEPQMSHPSRGATDVGVAELATEVHEAIMDPSVVPLGTATASPELLPTERLNRILASIARKSGTANNRYESPRGNTDLRRQIARRSIDWGASLSSDDIITTFGCTEALNLCLRAVTRPGDLVAVESPTYFGLLQILESLRLKAVEMPTDPREGICINTLKDAVRRKPIAALFLIPNFNNPLGGCMPDEHKKEIADLLAEHEIPIIEDDIYGDLYFDGKRPKTIKAFDETGNVLLCSSFSKTLSPGYRVGWTAPGRYFETVRSMKLMNSISTATLPQIAIAEMMRTGGYDHYLRKLRKAFSTQVQITTRAISRYFPAGTKVTRPMGGFVLWVEFPPGVNSLVLYRRALAKGVSLVPGPLFSPKRTYQNCIRLNCGHPWSERIEEAIVTVGQLASAML